MGPAGGVGIAFEDRRDQRTGGMLKIVAEVKYVNGERERDSEGGRMSWSYPQIIISVRKPEAVQISR